MKSDNRIFYIVLVLAFVNLLLWALVISANTKNDIMQVYFLDIGQGDSTLIVAPNGRKLLIDGGPDSGVLNELGRSMGFFDRTIDVVLATHPDQDHIGGLPMVIERYKVNNFIDSIGDSQTSSYQALENLVKEENIKTYFGKRGMLIVLDRAHGVYLHLLYPVADDFKFKETNDLSAVAKLVYGDTSIMLTGDAPKIVESMLDSTDGKYLKSTILKVGHHGSDTSSSRSFVEMVNPYFAVISAGLNNRYGHPKAITIKTLADSGVEILETAKEGTIVFKSNGIDVWTK